MIYTGPQYCVVCQDPQSMCRCDEQPVTKLAAKLVRECVEGRHETVVIKRDDYLTLCERAYKWANEESKRIVRTEVEPLTGDDRYWLEKLIQDVEDPKQLPYIQGFSPMRLQFMAKMLRRALPSPQAPSQNELAVADANRRLDAAKDDSK